MKKYLVTGVNSGLGKYFYKILKKDADGLTRKNYDNISNKYDTIIHCAFNTGQMEHSGMYNYINDNLFLTKELLENINYKRFVYISSVDVYRPASESGLYAQFKRYAESVVNHFDKTMILRLPVLLGEYMKYNHIHHMFENKPLPALSLASNSRFSYVLYKDVLNFIQENEDLFGIYDFVANDVIFLSQIEKEFKLNVKFGTYTYITTTYFDNPIYSNKTSLETIKEFMK